MKKNETKPFDLDDPRLTAYALGELDGEEARAVEAWLATSEEARAEVEAIRGFAVVLESELSTSEGRELTATQRRAIGERSERFGKLRRRKVVRRVGFAVTGLAAAAVVVSLCFPNVMSKRFRIGRADNAPHASSIVRPSNAAHRRSTHALESLRGLGYASDGLGYGGVGGDDGSDRLRSLGYVEDIGYGEGPSAEAYAPIVDNDFVRVADDPLSTFSIDVDTASYANVRRFLLQQSTLPPADAVRIEELINYFPYDYPAPDAGQPFSTSVEIASAPWQPAHRLVKIGLKGREVNFAERANANLVFLLDVSGSMNSPRKLPLLVDAMSMLVGELDATDRVAIAVYAGNSGLVLDSTTCSEKPMILAALERLQAGGSTNGGAGIHLAYEVAQRNYVEGGVNRVILCTDGDFNVGTTSEGELVRLIEDKAKGGVFLSVLGFGSGNLKDSTMEQLADKGNGNYAYIDSRMEARKVLVEQIGGTLVTIAKDVKIQVEFNPAEVEAFRLIGYENRVLAHQDFNDDTKDAGEIGSGHTVTALYEVVPKGVSLEAPGVDPLRYQTPTEESTAASSGELLTLKLRYKEPEGSTSKKLEVPVRDRGASLDAASPDLRFAAAVASFGMLLRDSKYKGDANWDQTLDLAREGQGADAGGYRLEFQLLVQRARALAGE